MPARRFSTVLVALIATLAMSALALPAQAQPLSASCARPSAASGNLRGIVRPAHSPTSSACHLFASFADPTVADGGDPPLLKHAGVVMGAAGTGTVTVTPIWWVPAGYSIPTGYRNLVERFIGDVAADSGKATNVFSPMTEYTSAAGKHIRYDLTAAASLTDTTAFPADDCTHDSGAGYSDGVAYTACLSNADLGAEVTALLARKGLAAGTSHLYVVMLPKQAELCGDSRNSSHGGDCSVSPSGGDFCAFHSWTSAPAVYAAMPYEEANGCITREAPNGVPDGDNVVSPLSHEMNEAITDPTGDGWYDDANYENGDECAWIFGDTTGPAGGLYNQTIDGHHYLLQLEFSNESFNAGGDACIAQRPLPTPYFAQPAPALPGKAIPFNGTGSKDRTVAPIASYAWSFGDGGTATGATPSHTYAAAGSYKVSITVTDADGWTASGSRTVVAGFAPGAPAASAAAASSSSATLKWSPPAEPGHRPDHGLHDRPRRHRQVRPRRLEQDRAGVDALVHAQQPGGGPQLPPHGASGLRGGRRRDHDGHDADLLRDDRSGRRDGRRDRRGLRPDQLDAADLDRRPAHHRLHGQPQRSRHERDGRLVEDPRRVGPLLHDAAARIGQHVHDLRAGDHVLGHGAVRIRTGADAAPRAGRGEWGRRYGGELWRGVATCSRGTDSVEDKCEGGGSKK